jgi:hypothetical protein
VFRSRIKRHTKINNQAPAVCAKQFNLSWESNSFMYTQKAHAKKAHAEVLSTTKAGNHFQKRFI